MHKWVLTKRHGRVLLEDKKNLTLTETDVCYSSVPPMNFFQHKKFTITLGTEIRWNSILSLISVLSQFS